MSDTPRSRKHLFSREDYLASPAVPTGQPPRDVLNTIWRKNEVYLDIGDYSIGSFVMMMWPFLLMCAFMLWIGYGREYFSWTVIWCLFIGGGQS